MVALLIILGFAVLVSFGLFLAFNSMLVFNSVHYMAVSADVLWRDPHYVHNLPNMLQQLYDAGFESPWPSRSKALSAVMFRRKLTAALKSDLPDAERFIQQHLSLWAFVQLHRRELQEVVLRRQILRARHILAETHDDNRRGCLLAFLNRCNDAEILSSSRLPADVDTIGWFMRLQAFDVLFREHGYYVSEEFSTLDHWQGAEDVTILEELSLSPPMPMRPVLLN